MKRLPLAVLGVASQLSFAPGRITGPVDAIQHPVKMLQAPLRSISRSFPCRSTVGSVIQKPAFRTCCGSRNCCLIGGFVDIEWNSNFHSAAVPEENTMVVRDAEMAWQRHYCWRDSLGTNATDIELKQFGWFRSFIQKP